VLEAQCVPGVVTIALAPLLQGKSCDGFTFLRLHAVVRNLPTFAYVVVVATNEGR
jgi:hypothetical protein